ncbi:hypothetical protein PACTADRAFT_48969 [Pachysolen tannophilus NRRL Y-2460]|uniref:U2 small nuclear ribonucleoprotein A' n=1 Tax=Pachysolen tannophilus NRRL Y-2460 TaxID=669874 RepID=A0A1E4TZP6_PACTA|nr:hypothetical protein PACTADRAFT_48969 [Pachysolen tannophilus NRRL Y-2460]
MKLTPQLLLSAQSYLNPVGDRVIILRGLKINTIENFGVTNDSNETVDLTDNDIAILGNFPHLLRLKTILISKNRIDTIAENLNKSLPNLATLQLTSNYIKNFSQIEPLKNCINLQNLYLKDNPICDLEYYRLWIIWRIPSLKILDFEKIKDKERNLAKKLFGEDDNNNTELALKILSEDKVNKNSQSGADIGIGKVELAKEEKQLNNLVKKLTDEERKKLQQELINATSLVDIERIENALKNGYI